jgi:Chitin binding Peritrophin-A domain
MVTPLLGYISGYYADPEAQCQVFHVCAEDGDGPRSKWSFLCPNGTIFNQNYFICDWLVRRKPLSA